MSGAWGRAPRAWKLLRDPYLGPIAARLGAEAGEPGETAALAAGFFYDDDPEDAPLDDVDWLCTPRPKRAPRGDHPVVLLATGGFCPVHPGHLEMMEHARGRAEEAGLEVIGGYLSPGHDAYLTMKAGPAMMIASERLRLCAEAVRGSDWLSVDPWEALHRRGSVNYTDVAGRLETYLRAHVHPGVEVTYVCGADNARFASAFVERGRCIVVGRPGGEDEASRWCRALAGNARTLWAEGDHPGASRALRPAVAAVPPRPRIAVRVEDERTVRTIGLPAARLRAFHEALLELLARHAEVRFVPLVDRPPPREETTSVLSLDAMLPQRANLAVSRLFAMGGHQLLGHVARPGAPPLGEQLAALVPGVYELRDDDSVTGGTIAFVRTQLPPRVTIASTSFAIEHAADEDVVDARDLLLGTDHGGLVLALPGGGIGRAPYLLPYVDPYARIGIAASRELSIAGWRLNERIFAATDLRVRDLPAYTRATVAFAADDEPLDRLCAWHAERLERLRAPAEGATAG